jgi:hypothetical protein
MNAFQGFGLIVTGHVTAISFAVIAMIVLSKNNPARRHSMGVIGLLLVLGSPFLAGALPQSAWWRVAAPTAFNAISQATSNVDSRGAAASNFEPALPVAAETSDSGFAISETSISNPLTLEGGIGIRDNFVLQQGDPVSYAQTLLELTECVHREAVLRPLLDY